MAKPPIPMLGRGAPAGNPIDNPWEVRSDSGLEGIFADEGDAQAEAEVLRASGVPNVTVDRRERGTRPRPPRHGLRSNPAHDRLFAGITPTGIVYADRHREIDGDYARIAFLPFQSLRLQWSTPNVPPELREMVEHDAASIIARRGEPFEISSSGQTVILGGSQGRPIGAPPQYHAPQGRPPGVPNRSNPSGPQLGDTYVLGTYGPGSHVQLGVWKFPSHRPAGVIEPGNWVSIIGNYADTTGYVVVRDDESGARYEVDGRQPIVKIDIANRMFQAQNPAGLTAKGERMYEHVKRAYEKVGDIRAKEIAARTVLAQAKHTPGLRKKPRRSR